MPGAEPPPSPMTFDGFLDHAEALGVRVAQIADNLPLHDLSAPELASLRSHAWRKGIDVEVGTRGIGEQHILRYLDLCAFFGSRILRVVIDSAGDHPSPDGVVQRLQSLMPRFRDAGVVLAFENHDRFDAATFVYLVKRLGLDATGICLDTVNSFGALEGPDAVIRALAPYVVNLHLKDFVVRRHPSMMGFEITGAPAGQGRLDVPSLLQTLQEHERDVSVILELWPPAEASSALTAAKEEQWTFESIRYLRGLIAD